MVGDLLVNYSNEDTGVDIKNTKQLSPITIEQYLHVGNNSAISGVTGYYF